MKRLITYLSAVAVVGVTFVSCGRDEVVPQVLEPQKEEIVLNDFILEKTEVTIKRGEKERIKITSGNGEYDYTQNLYGVALMNISRDGQYIEITAIQDGGAISTHITDVKSGKRIKITINTTK